MEEQRQLLNAFQQRVDAEEAAKQRLSSAQEAVKYRATIAAPAFQPLGRRTAILPAPSPPWTARSGSLSLWPEKSAELVDVGGYQVRLRTGIETVKIW